MLLNASINDDRGIRRWLAKYGVLLRRNFNEPYMVYNKIYFITCITFFKLISNKNFNIVFWYLI